MNNYHISLADSWHQEDQVIYETWQVILIKCRACGCKVAGREQILSRQRAAEQHTLRQTRWAELSGLPQLSCKPGPSSPGQLTGFSWRGKGIPQASCPSATINTWHTNKPPWCKAKVTAHPMYLSHNRVLTWFKAWLSASWAQMEAAVEVPAAKEQKQKES